MTAAAEASPKPAASRAPGSVLHRRSDRHRRTVEKVIAALVLLAALAITVVLLGLQWLGNQSTGSSAPPLHAHTLTSEVQAL
jgi:hypothetical protein